MIDKHKMITRRSLIAGAAAGLTLSGDIAVRANQVPSTVPVDLGHGLEIRDYRLFPTKDVMRFIAEIYNTTEEIVDTPSVGVVLPHLSEETNFGVANPVGAVLHPETSACLIGVAPSSLTSDDEWGEPEWILCNNVTTRYVGKVADWAFDFSHEVKIITPQHASVEVTVTNRNDRQSQGLLLKGIVRDGEGRLTGTLLPIDVGIVPSMYSSQLFVNIQPDLDYIANPFVLMNDVGGTEVSFSLQPQFSIVQTSCEAILPGGQH